MIALTDASWRDSSLEVDSRTRTAAAIPSCAGRQEPRNGDGVHEIPGRTAHSVRSHEPVLTVVRMIPAAPVRFALRAPNRNVALADAATMRVGTHRARKPNTTSSRLCADVCTGSADLHSELAPRALSANSEHQHHDTRFRRDRQPAARPAACSADPAGYVSALALMASNSAWVIVPLSRSCLALSISLAAPPVPAVLRT